MHYIKPLRVRLVLTVVTLALIFASFIPARRAQAAAAGALDSTFGTGGIVTTSFGHFDQALAIVVQADGKTVLGGNYDITDVGQGFALTRYTTSGALDPSFGVGGKVQTSFVNSDGIQALALQPNGKLVAAGETLGSDSFSDVAIARYNTNGSLDTSFGSGGKVTLDLGGGDAATAVAITPDNKIVIAGSIFTFTGSSLFVARFNANGSLDSSFGQGGKITPDLKAGRAAAHGVAVQPNGKIIVAAEAGLPGFPQSCTTMRLNSDGTFDLSFGAAGSGIVIEDFGVNFSVGNAVTLQPDGKILVAGMASTPTTAIDFLLVRYDSNGISDPQFGNGGKTLVDFSGNFDIATSIVLQPDGKIILGGTTQEASGFTEPALARINSNGTLDLPFGSNGKVQVNVAGHSSFVNGVAVGPNNKILAGGYTRTGDFEADFLVFRLNMEQTNFDQCVQDDSNGNLLQLNSVTGEYQFTNCGGMSVGGTGTVTRLGNLITLQHNVGDRRVTARIDLGTHRATASVQLLSTGKSFTITDRNTTDNTCSCK